MNNKEGILSSYPERYEDWEHGYLAGNGRVGIIDLCNPTENYIIYCHRRFFLASDTTRSFATVDKSTVNKIRDACFTEDWKTANDLANSSNQWKSGGEGQKHPGFALQNIMQNSGSIKNYKRICDFSNGEIKVTFEDDNGTFEKRIFVSRTDNVVVEKIIAPKGALTCSLKMEIKEEMHFPEKLIVNTYAKNDGIGITVKYTNTKRDIGYEGYAKVDTLGGTAKAEGDTLYITNADSITIYSYCDKYYENCSNIFKQLSLKKRLDTINEDYDSLFIRHKNKHNQIFNRVSLDLKGSNNNKSNSELIDLQKKSDTPLPDMYERLFYSGRYLFMACCDHKGAPDLLGLWTGDCNVGWDGFFHLDANFNLQCSGGVIGNLCDMMEGYFYLFDKWAEDFRTIAKKLLSCRGMIGGGNTPGESSGLISGIDSYFYPYHYVTGEISWLLYPFYEYYRATNDTNFLKTRLYPYLLEMSDFYEDFLVLKDSNGKFVFAGSISPENQPKDVPYSLVNNSLFDIEGARFVFKTLIEAGEILHEDRRKIDYWHEMLSLLPDYLNDDDGALCEWAYKGLHNKYTHRHCSGLMGVWPYRYITPEKNIDVFTAASKQLEFKDRHNYQGAGHGLLHAALIAAGVNNTDSLKNKILEFVQTDFFFETLSSAHYKDMRVFCTDVCHTMPTVIIQSIIASDNDAIEILPACPFGKGEICGILTKCKCEVNRFSWDENNAELFLTSKIDQTIKVFNRNKNISKYVLLEKDKMVKVIL